MQTLEYDLEKQKRNVIPAIRKAFESCTGCGLCLQNCVFHYYSKRTAKKIMTEIKEFIYSKGLRKKLSKKTRQYIWTCGVCEHCMLHCPLPEDKQVPKSPSLILLRAILVAKNQAPFIVRFLRRILLRDTNNPLLKYLWPLATKLLVSNWYSDKDQASLKERRVIETAQRLPKKGAEICFFGGCGHTAAAPDVVYGATAILDKAGVDYFTIGSHEFCCGVIYAVLGFIDLWFEHSYKVMKRFLDIKPRPKILLLHCPGCYTAYQFNVEKYGVITPLNYLQIMPNPIKMMHITQYINELIKEKKLEFTHEVPLTVTYNDNCSLGRRMSPLGLAVYEEPREILQSIPGVKLIDSDFNRENSYCCGALATKTLGFGTNVQFPIGKDGAYQTQLKLFQNILEKGSHNLVTPCMGCYIVFEDAARVWQKKLGRKINILDMNELLNYSLGNKIPRRQNSLNNMIQNSLPLIKLPIIKLLPRFIKTQAFRDLLTFVREYVRYIGRRNIQK